MKTVLLSIALAVAICVFVVIFQITRPESTIGDTIMLYILLGGYFLFYILYLKEAFR